MALRMGDVFRLGDALTPEEKLVLLALIDYGARIHPSQATIAVKTGYGVRTVGKVVASLRKKGLITTSQRGAKSLDYTVVAPPSSARGAEHGRHAVPSNTARGAEQHGTTCRGIITTQGTTQPNQAPAGAGGGWEVSWDRRSRIAMRDRFASVDANIPALVKAMTRHGCPPTEVQGWVDALCDNWARTGEDAYSCFAAQLPGIEVARDTWAFLCARMRKRGVAA